MWKLLLCCSLSVVLSAANSAATGAVYRADLTPLPLPLPLLKTLAVHYEPTLAQVVGEMVERVPSAISHQSQTVVHSHAERVRPLLAPLVGSYAATDDSLLLPRSAAAFVHAHAPYVLRYQHYPHRQSDVYPAPQLLYASPMFQQ